MIPNKYPHLCYRIMIMSLLLWMKAAASELTRYKSPWLTGDCEWTPKMIKKAVVNMALKLNKACFKSYQHLIIMNMA